MDYVIARKWPSGDLCPYAYGSQVFTARTVEEMQEMREFINGRCDPEHRGEYKIYVISESPVED